MSWVLVRAVAHEPEPDPPTGSVERELERACPRQRLHHCRDLARPAPKASAQFFGVHEHLGVGAEAGAVEEGAAVDGGDVDADDLAGGDGVEGVAHVVDP